MLYNLPEPWFHWGDQGQGWAAAGSAREEQPDKEGNIVPGARSHTSQPRPLPTPIVWSRGYSSVPVRKATYYYHGQVCAQVLVV